MVSQLTKQTWSSNDSFVIPVSEFYMVFEAETGSGLFLLVHFILRFSFLLEKHVFAGKQYCRGSFGGGLMLYLYP